MARVGDRFAVVERLELRKLVGMLLEKIAESPDKPRTLAWGDAGRRSRLVNAACRSWRRQESRDGCGDGRFDPLPRVAAQVSQHASVRRGR